MPNARKLQYTVMTTTKQILLGLTLCFCYCSIFGQLTSTGDEKKIDSLLTIIKTEKEDTNQVNALNNLGFEYSVPDFTKAKFYLTNAEQLARKLNYKKGIANSLSYLGIAYETKGNYFEALNAQISALKIREEIGDKSGISYSIHYIGDIYFGQSDLSEKISSKEEYNNKALEEFFKALKIAEEIKDEKSIANTFNCIGNSYREQENYSTALEYYLKAVKIRERLEDKINLSTTLVNIGKLYLKQENYSDALEYLFRASTLSEEVSHKRTHAKALGTIGTIYYLQKKYVNSIEFSLKSLSLAKQIGYLEYIAKANKLLSQIYSADDFSGHNGDKALAYYKSYIMEKDSIDTQKANQAVLQFDFDKKEELAKAEHAKQIAVSEAEKKQQQIVIWSVASGLLFMMVFSGFIFRSLNITRKQKVLIEKSKQIIQEKNKDITDSITYAKRIQQAKLPDKKEIQQSFPNSFVLFKPKDIVSGDFYYFHKNDKYIFIASADCTGHGVPGAFMSMIGSEKLDDALGHSTDTSEILRHLNKAIKTSLKQNESDTSTRDGMDIALCSVDSINYVVKYAGANRPLWVIRNGQTTVEEIKATKKAIGGLTEDNQHFETHALQLQRGDSFYIFSDGYADTFNGKDGKKLTTKKFKETLLSIQDKPMADQGAHLDNFIENWKAGTEQVDDILVIGVRL